MRFTVHLTYLYAAESSRTQISFTFQSDIRPFPLKQVNNHLSIIDAVRRVPVCLCRHEDNT